MASTHEDAFREIQLSGKQLVFVCMAAVVIAVGIFLMGVQVGRGVLAERGVPAASDVTASADREPPPPPASASQGASAPVTAGEKLSYAERLASPEPPAEQLKKAEDTPPPTPRSEVSVPSLTTRSAAAPAGREGGPPRAPVSEASTEPPGPGFEIQLAALRVRGEADAIVKRLTGKGYPAYVVAPPKGSPSMFRVRVGKYRDRHEADTVAAKLQKEEQFKPWVVH
jgi:cell division septation protein DedD